MKSDKTINHSIRRTLRSQTISHAQKPATSKTTSSPPSTPSPPSLTLSRSTSPTPTNPEPHHDKASSSAPSPTLSANPHLLTYHIGHGERGVLSYEPYKSALLPYWRFRTVPIARESAAALWTRFVAYGDAGDFVGMDMARKFVQMGMTRAKRYANYKGGKKYVKEEPVEGVKKEDEDEDQDHFGDKLIAGKRQLEKSKAHEGKEEKEAASLVFREMWERCKADERYLGLKAEFLKAQKAVEKEVKMKAKTEQGEDRLKREEVDDPEDVSIARRKRKR